ncbi:hypothetical protein MXB_3337 [Myxobolus squamalis]|nr:hypothetical protein MXB_3337 [Myxobolus squamalis]
MIPVSKIDNISPSIPLATSSSGNMGPRCYSQHNAVERFETMDLPRPSIFDIPRFVHRSAVQQIARPDYDSSKCMYPYNPHLASNNFQQFSPLHISPSSNSFRVLHQYPYLQPYINGCNNFIPNMPIIDRIKVGPTSLPFAPIFSTPRDPLLEHNYAKTNDISKTDIEKISLNNSFNIEIKGAIKRSYGSQMPTNDVNSSTNDGTKNPVPKKKRNYQHNKESLKKPMISGFVRELLNIETPNGERRKIIVYKAPDGVVLSKKLDVKMYLNLHPNPELQIENFSFDTRLSFSEKKTREFNNKYSQSEDRKLNNSSLPKKSISKKVSNSSAQSLNNSKVETPVKKSLSLKHRKLISKYFKKVSDASKYFDGLSTGSYRRKLPNLRKINISITVDNQLDSSQSLSIYSDIICFDEFFSSFASYLDISIEMPQVYEFLACLVVTEIDDSFYFKMLSQLLKLVVVNDNFANDVNDNIYSLKWDWLLTNEVYRLYLHARSRFLVDIQPIPESSYHVTLIDLLKQLDNNKLIYNLKPHLKTFALRFLIDQICSTNIFAGVINEVVENVGKNRRDKYHIETKLRQLRTKTSIITKNPTQAEEILEAPNIDIEKQEKLKYLGSDRYGRQYNYSHNQKLVYIEALANLPGVVQNKFLGCSVHSKKPLLTPENVNQLVAFSTQSILKLKLKDVDMNIEKFKEYIKKDLLESAINHDDNKTQKNTLLQILIDSPKMLRNVSEDELALFLDVFSRNYSKHKNKSVGGNEFGDGWWLIENKNAMNEFVKCLNQRGIREHHLYKCFIKYQEFLNELPETPSDSIETNIVFNYDSQLNISYEKLTSKATNLILKELREISMKMDKYLSKISIQPDKPILVEYENLSQTSAEIMEIVKSLIAVFVSCCERKFDRPWLSKWNDSIQMYSGLSTIYLYCQSLKLKIDPNSKICKVCNTIDDTLTITECHVCLLSAHESCLEEPMKKIKKTKMICSTCHNESILKSSRVCKICNIKTGKTLSCCVCNEFFHSKCLGKKPKNKHDAIVCEACTTANKILNPKIFTPPSITFSNAPFKKFSSECQKVLKILQEHKDGQPFAQPVDSSVLSYYDIIKKPMEFKTIARKVKTHKYKNVTQFYNDILQIFANCYIFNEDNSKIAKCGLRLQKLFEKEWKAISANFSV